jgi:K+-sensing histidine kinase KdpD
MKLTKVIYVFLLIYIVAALIFWGLSLQLQNKEIYIFEKNALIEHKDTFATVELYNQALNKAHEKFTTRNIQFIAEGFFFTLVIIFAAIIVYKSILNNLKFTDRQNNFMLSITHELKSPIAAVKLNLETIKRRKLDEDTQIMLVERCINETNRLNDLCNNLLLVTQMESNHFEPVLEETELKPIIQDSVKIFSQRSKHNIIDNLENITLNTDPVLIKIVVNNLIENAIKYTLPGTKIEVLLHEEEDKIILSVIDEGGGIADNEKTKIFSKFYRIGNENYRKSKGTGLGLYLTAQIIEQMKGNISVRDNEPFGTIFEVILPKT